MHCEFTLMTIGGSRNTSGTADSRAASMAAQPRSQPSASAEADQRNKTAAMPPPNRPASRRLRQPGSARPVPSSPRPSAESDSLFVPAESDEDEQRWDPAQYHDDEETLGWDASGNDVRPHLYYGSGASKWLTVCRIWEVIRHFEIVSLRLICPRIPLLTDSHRRNRLARYARNPALRSNADQVLV
jgi:hypothetical protein